MCDKQGQKFSFHISPLANYIMDGFKMIEAAKDFGPLYSKFRYAFSLIRENQDSVNYSVLLYTPDIILACILVGFGNVLLFVDFFLGSIALDEFLWKNGRNIYVL